jgi:hypothetical protein
MTAPTAAAMISGFTSRAQQTVVKTNGVRYANEGRCKSQQIQNSNRAVALSFSYDFSQMTVVSRTLRDLTMLRSLPPPARELLIGVDNDDDYSNYNKGPSDALKTTKTILPLRMG